MPSSRGHAWIGIGIVGDEAHVERLGHAEHLGADIADAERAERAADQADAHVVDALGEAGGGLAGQPVLDQQLAGQRQHQGDDARPRPAGARRPA